MINVDKSRIAVFGECGTVLTEFTCLTNSLKIKLQDFGLNGEQTNAILTRAFFNGMTEDFEYEEKPIPEGGLTDDK